MKILSNPTRNEWTDYILSHQSTSIYHDWGWGEILNKTYDLTPQRYMILNKEGEAECIFPLQYVFNIFSREYQVSSLPFSSFCGPHFDKNTHNVQNGINQILSHYIKQNVIIDIRSSKKVNLGSYFAHFDYYRNYVVKIETNEKDIWSTIFRKRRNLIKNSIKQGLETSISTTDASLLIFYNIYIQNMKYLGSPPHSLKFFKTMKKIFGNHFKIFITHSSGLPIAAHILLIKNHIASSVFSASLKEYRSLHPNDNLYWSILLWCLDNGLTYLDMGRTRPRSGVEHFKKSWGARPLKLFYYNTNLTSSSQYNENQFRIGSKFWAQLMPIPLTQHIGPLLKKGSP